MAANIASDILPLEEQLCALDSQAQFFPERAFEFDGLDGTVVCAQEMHTGGMIWDAEVILAHRLVERYGSNSEAVGRGCDSLVGKRVIELGAGAGLAGIVAAQLGAAVVVFTEIEKVLPVLTRNVEANLPNAIGTRVDDGNAEGGGRGGGDDGGDGNSGTGVCDHGDRGSDGDDRECDGGAVRVACCEQWWGEELAGPVAKHAPFDLILVADCIYDPELFAPLCETIVSCAAPRSECWISYEQRRRDITPFFEQFDHVPECSGRRWPTSPLLTRGAELARTHLCCVHFGERTGPASSDGAGADAVLGSSEGAEAPVLSAAHVQEIAKAAQFRSSLAAKT